MLELAQAINASKFRFFACSYGNGLNLDCLQQVEEYLFCRNIVCFEDFLRKPISNDGNQLSLDIANRAYHRGAKNSTGDVIGIGTFFTDYAYLSLVSSAKFSSYQFPYSDETPYLVLALLALFIGVGPEVIRENIKVLACA